uniref:SFRICE_040697 n=1 Tax=Spodoptera frugiperda TaxID=7108 RepID=A0A2H1WZC9_SPOFR
MCLFFKSGRAMLRLDRNDTIASQKTGAGNALVTPLVFWVSMGGGDCLPSGDTSAPLLAYTIKNNLIYRPTHSNNAFFSHQSFNYL